MEPGTDLDDSKDRHGQEASNISVKDKYGQEAFWFHSLNGHLDMDQNISLYLFLPCES